MCRLRDLVYGATEGEFVRLGGLCEAAEFADELQRRRADFFVRRRRFEVMQGLDVSAHSFYLLAVFTTSWGLWVVSIGSAGPDSYTLAIYFDSYFSLLPPSREFVRVVAEHILSS